MLLATPVLGAKPSAPGNNGTVKVHDGADEASPITQNNPHVCDFHLDFLFADADQAGDWWIQSWSPGGDRSIVLEGSYLTDAAGYDRAPASGTLRPAGRPLQALLGGRGQSGWQGERQAQGLLGRVWRRGCATVTMAADRSTPTIRPTSSHRQ